MVYKEKWKKGNTEDGWGEEGARRSWRKEKMIEQVGALGLNQEVLRENWITGCCVKMQQWETSLHVVCRRSGWSGRWSGPILPVLLGWNFLNCNSVCVHQL